MKKRIFSMVVAFCMLLIMYPSDVFATSSTITVVLLGNHGTATVADAYSESTSLIWQDSLVNGNKVGTDTINHINQGPFNETNLKAGYTVIAESGYFIDGFYRCEEDYINHDNGIENENFEPMDPSYTDGFLTTATISELTWPNEKFYISFKRIPDPASINVILLGDHGTATVASGYSESTGLIWQDDLVSGNKVGTDTIKHINQGPFNETNLKAGYTVVAESGYFIDGFYRCEEDYINHDNGIENENFEPMDPSYTDGFLTTATISALTWPNEKFYISFKRIPNPSTVNVILLGNHGTATVAGGYSESTGLIWQDDLVSGNKVGTDTIKHINQGPFNETNLKAGYTVVAESGYLINGFYRSEQDYIDKNNGFENGNFELLSPIYTDGALTTAIVSEITWPRENFYISFCKISDAVANIIDTAIATANSAKTGVIINDNPASSVSRGVRFVTNTEMSALNTAVQTAINAKTTVTTVDQAKTVANTLNSAVITFNAAIKTGTYSGSGSSGGGGGGATTSATSGTPQEPSVVVPIQNKSSNAPVEAKTNVTAKVDTNGAATLAVPDKTINDAIKAAQEAAKKAGAEKNGIAVTINITTDRTVNSIATELPKTSIDSLVKAGVSQVNIQSQTANIRLDLSTLRQIQSVTGGDTMLKVSKANIKTLSANAQNAIGNRPVLNLSITGNGNNVRTFGGGSVEISIPYTLQKEENADNICAVYIDDKGNVNYLTNSSYDSTTHMLIFNTPHFSIYGVGYKTDELTFTDINGHWGKKDIEFVTAKGLLYGTGNNLFSPNTSMTRGMFVTALGRLAGIDISSYKTSSFEDVKAGSYYLPYVEWAAKENIVKGNENKVFAPNKTITREEMAVIMGNYAKVMGYTVPKTHTEVVFSDNNSISTWAADMVKQMQIAGVIMGKENNKFDSKATATRAEVSAVLSRYIELVINADKSETV